MHAWEAQVKQTGSDRVRRTAIVGDGLPVTFRQALDLLRSNAGFRTFLIDVLNECPFQAYFWETPPVSSNKIDRAFEFVQIDGPMLCSLSPDPHSFDEHFREAHSADIVSFVNLGGDAWLIAPCPRASADTYPHMAPFLRNAPRPQVHALWTRVGEDMLRRSASEPRPTWLSTAGLGVGWLHIRLDSRPKYYHYAPFRDEV